MRHLPPKTKRFIPRISPPDTSIRDLPLGIHKVPPNEWILRLRRYDGTWERRTVRGTLFDAREHRDFLLAEGPFSEAWLSEGREQRMRKPRGPVKVPRAESLHLSMVRPVTTLDDEPYHAPGDFET